MKCLAVLALLGIAQAHYTFPGLIHNGVTEADWTYVRETTNHYSHGPVQDVRDSQLRCYELQPGSNGAKTKNVNAGDKVGFRVDGGIQHPGPLQFYMAKAPSGATAETFNGDGAVWFKIYEEHPTVTSAGLTWASNGQQTVDVTIPRCLTPGYYLLRVEHIGLHSAGSTGGAQFYQGCAQLYVSGSGTKTFSGVSIPGAYSASDPGILINLYWPIPTSYKNPGPAVVSVILFAILIFIVFVLAFVIQSSAIDLPPWTKTFQGATPEQQTQYSAALLSVVLVISAVIVTAGIYLIRSKAY
ncbi:glycosyl hydrolase family 61-domain-containing protein [Xylaria bambusicola]|uniref:glycosyl hydrolase family 61-domain-containing protein n=1 Tax=Xylaria bambusicola TaxID=326684 RepID=UPI002008D94F|nr:glycosyl hydrolase family 61-domain-containing protein [Xylaria bambusicola]KAI0503240.1 glycosyl hydrolase family 61-domain-containing protein [Xylaria bambusicola]